MIETTKKKMRKLIFKSKFLDPTRILIQRHFSSLATILSAVTNMILCIIGGFMRHLIITHEYVYTNLLYVVVVWDIHFINFLKSAYTKLESSWENLYILLYIVQAYSTNLNILRILNAMLMDDDCYLCTTSIKLFISSHLTAPCH